MQLILIVVGLCATVLTGVLTAVYFLDRSVRRAGTNAPLRSASTEKEKHS